MARGREVLAASNQAVYVWGFALFFTGIVAYFSFMFYKDGPPRWLAPGPTWALLVVFWLCAAFVAWFGLTARRGRVEWDGARAWLIVDGPFSRGERDFVATDVTALAIVKTTTGDGHPWFKLMITLHGGSPVEVAAGRKWPRLGEHERRIRAALHLPATQGAARSGSQSSL